MTLRKKKKDVTPPPATVEKTPEVHALEKRLETDRAAWKTELDNRDLALRSQVERAEKAETLNMTLREQIVQLADENLKLKGDKIELTANRNALAAGMDKMREIRAQLETRCPHDRMEWVTAKSAPTDRGKKELICLKCQAVWHHLSDTAFFDRVKEN